MKLKIGKQQRKINQKKVGSWGRKKIGKPPVTVIKKETIRRRHKPPMSRMRWVLSL